jgi:hypothetical protein
MSGVGFSTRPAHEADAAAMAEIYNEGIADRVATFETTPRTAQDVLGWLDGQHPALVVVDADGRVVGYAVTFAYADRCCYAGVAEFSVYVRRSHRGTKSTASWTASGATSSPWSDFSKPIWARRGPAPSPSPSRSDQPLGVILISLPSSSSVST